MRKMIFTIFKYLFLFKLIFKFLKHANEPNMGDKSVETLGSKIRFLSVLVTFAPLPLKTMLIFFYFLDIADHSTYTTLNWGAGSIRGLTLAANEIQQLTSGSISQSVIS